MRLIAESRIDWIQSNRFICLSYLFSDWCYVWDDIDMSELLRFYVSFREKGFSRIRNVRVMAYLRVKNTVKIKPMVFIIDFVIISIFSCSQLVNNMINLFTKLFIRGQKSLALTPNIPVYHFILGRMFKKDIPQQNEKQSEEQMKRKANRFQFQKKIMKQQIEDENQYDFLQRQKDIELNKDFRKQKQIYKNTIPEGVGKLGFNELVYWSQNAHTPEQIIEIMGKFNKSALPKMIEDRAAFLQFVGNVKETVYLAQSYKILVDYAYFGYKYEIQQVQYWLKIQEKVLRRPPKSQEQTDQLIDILFVMGNMQVGELIFSKSEKMLDNKNFTVEQIAKLIIAYFKTGKGQREWIIKLLANLQNQINQINCDVIQSILPILKQSKNVPMTFDEKLQTRIFQVRKQMSLNVICVIAHYFGFQRGEKDFWQMLEEETILKIKQIKKEKGRIPSLLMGEFIKGVLSSYKFSTEFVLKEILGQIQARDCKVLYKLGPKTLSTLSKCLYIYELEQRTKNIEQTIQGLIMKQFEKMNEVKNEDLIHVLKEYTVTRLGSREFYVFLEQLVNYKLTDLNIERYTVEALTAIYEQSSLCSTDTLQLLKGLAYD